MTRKSPRGRRAVYCSPECRPSHYKHRTARQLQVEVEHEPTEDGARPVGRVWFVQLRNGTRTVVVADGLGRPSADHLANQIGDLIERVPAARGGDTE
ncbi:MAG: hypothetical protein ACRDZR_06290 [Acidimicrobiales bacterium]